MPRTHSSRRPNVLLVMTDDMGFGDLSRNGNPYLETPQLDALAAAGTEFRNFYVTPVCSPTRAGLMTGRYHMRTKVFNVGATGSWMSPEEVTIADCLAAAGYRTGMFGKWHLGDAYPLRPQDRGFQETLWHPFSNITTDFPRGNDYFDPWLFRNGKLEQSDGYVMDVYTDATIEFMRSSVAAGEPFFAYLPTTLVHNPLQAPESMIQSFRDQGLPESTARVYGMMRSVDENMGRLVAALDELGVREDTMVIFLSDNGPAIQDVERYRAGLRGYKGHPYEGGVRVPFYVQYPARYDKPQVIETPAAYIDVLPTILDVCDVEQPLGLHPDGRSLKPLMDDPATVLPERDIVIQRGPGLPERYQCMMLREKRYKLVQMNASVNKAARLQMYYDCCEADGYTDYEISNELRFELYDLENDPAERHDLAAEQPHRVESMRARYDAWFDDVMGSRGLSRPLLILDSERQDPAYLTTNAWLEPRRWDMDVRTPGAYDLTVYWHPGARAVDGRAAVRLEAAGRKLEATVDDELGEHTFKDIAIPGGLQSFRAWTGDCDEKQSVTLIIRRNPDGRNNDRSGNQQRS